MIFHFTIAPGIDRAIEISAHWLVVMWGYAWAKVILSLWIEDNPRALTSFGKLIAGLISIAIAAGFATIIGLIMFKDFNSFVAIICIMTVSCAIAMYHLYKKIRHISTE